MSAINKKNKKKVEDLTPLEKAKRLKEENEKKAKEEEEIRLQFEKEEQERREKELIEKKRKDKLDKLELTKIIHQFSDLDELLSNNNKNLIEAEILKMKNLLWKKYTDCATAPNSIVLKEMNTYLSLLADDTNTNQIHNILKESILILQLINELMQYMYESKTYKPTENLLLQNEQTLFQLEEILATKLDAATHNLMVESSQIAAPDTDYIASFQNSSIKLSIFVNLSKNPRLKNVDFEETGVIIEMNSFLNKLDCSIRALFMKYDHLSKHCPSYYSKLMLSEAKIEVKNNLSHENNEEIVASDVVSKEEISHSFNTFDSAMKIDSDEEAEDDDQMLEKTDRIKIIDEPEVEIEKFDPKKFTFIMQEKPDILYEMHQCEADVLNMRQFMTIGGCFSIDLLHTPPQPKQINNWTVLLLVEPIVVFPIEYKAEVASLKKCQTVLATELSDASSLLDATAINSQAPVIDEEQEDEDDDRRLQERKTPILVTFKVPDVVILNSTVSIAHFNHSLKLWKTSGFDNVNYNNETRDLSMRIYEFGAFALICERHRHMPYKSWSMIPDLTTSNTATLIITTQHLQIEIIVTDGLVSLEKPELPELNWLLQRKMSLNQLIEEMRFAGLDVFPQPDSYHFVNCQPINSSVEDLLYREMGLIGSVMMFGWSQWSRPPIQSDNNIVTKISFNNQEQQLLMFGLTRSIVLKMEEDASEFSEFLNPNIELETNLYHLAKHNICEELQSHLANTTAEFANTYYQLLASTRIIAFS